MWLTVTLQYYWDNTFDRECEDLVDDSIQFISKIISQYTLDNEIMLSDSVHKLTFLSI